MDKSSKDQLFLSTRSRRLTKSRKESGENEKDKQFKANFDNIRGQICNSSNKESSVLSIISLINLHKINKNSNLHFFTSHHVIPSFMLPSIPRIEPNKRYITLKIKKSTIKQKCLFNKKFIITSRGVIASQKKSDGCVSIGRQQINDFGERINDIYLFPTDACISRSHCKIIYSDFLVHNQKVKETLHTLFMINHSRLNQYAIVKDFPQDLLARIAKFAIPKQRVYLQDNDTIFGTYVRIKVYNPLNIFNQIFPRFTDFCVFSFPNKKLSNFISNCDDNFMTNRVNNYHDSEKRKRVMKLFERRTLLLKDDMNFLFDSKAGFVVSSIGSLEKVITSVNIHLDMFGSECNDYIEIKSNDKVFNNQSFDISSKVFKLILNKSELLSLTPQETSECIKYSFLYLVMTLGDPCGIMNRGNEYLFVARRNTDEVLNFNFNLHEKCSNKFVDGFLISKDFDAAIQVQSESEFAIYYNKFIDQWAISDINSFSSEDSFGLWLGTSPDKRKNVRFHQTRKFVVYDGDYIKISETILKMKVNENVDNNMDIF